MMLIITFCIIALLFTLADVYIVLSVLKHTLWIAKVWLFIPALAYWVLILWMFISGDVRQTLINSLIWTTVIVVLSTLIFTLIVLIGQGLGRLWHPFYQIFLWIGGIVAAVCILVAVFGSLFGWRRLEVKKNDITLANLPEDFNDYRIAQISDFHIGVYGSTPGAVERIVRRVNALNPDVIVFTGDLVNMSPEELTQFKEILGQLYAPDGVISILGNHDYCVYKKYTGTDTPERALKRVIEAEESMGWNLLRNQAVQIVRGNDSIAIIGVENAGDRHFPDKSDLRKATQGLPVNECKILLSHDPSHWRREVLRASDVQLTLSGHTHAMQLKLWRFSPASWIYPEWSGLYKEGSRQLYVSTGVGGNVAFRLGVYPTIDLLTLHCPKQAPKEAPKRTRTPEPTPESTAGLSPDTTTVSNQPTGQVPGQTSVSTTNGNQSSGHNSDQTSN